MTLQTTVDNITADYSSTGRSSVQVTQTRSRMSGPRFMRRHSASSCGRHERQPARRRWAPTKGSKATDKDFSSENAIKFRLRVCDKQRGRIRRVCPFFSFFLLPWWLLSVQPQGAQTGIYAKRTTDKAFVCYRMENSAGREFQSMRSTWEILNVTMAKLNIISLANKWKLLAILAK